jgi:dephospho-CoA kinase
MIRIGIIGGIGSGKSFISMLFGYPVFNADYYVKLIYKKILENMNLNIN